MVLHPHLRVSLKRCKMWSTPPGTDNYLAQWQVAEGQSARIWKTASRSSNSSRDQAEQGLQVEQELASQKDAAGFIRPGPR